MDYKKIFEEHIVNKTVTEAIDLLNNSIEKYPEYKEVDEIIRLSVSLKYIAELIVNANCYLTQKSCFDNLNNHLTTIKTHLTNFNNNKTYQLTNISTPLDSALTYASQIIINEKTGNKLVAIDLRNILEERANSFEKLKKIMEETSSSYEVKTKELIQQLDNSNSDLNTIKQRVDTYLTNLQTTFNISESDRLKKFNDFIDQNKKELEKINAANKKEFETIKNKFVDASQATQKEMEIIKDNTTKLYQIIANTGIAGNYNKNANDERRNANIMRCISIVIFAIISILALYIIYTFQKDSTNWQSALVKILATSLLTGLAAYTTSESSKHRKLERKYRNMELELTALDPFIENMPDEKKVEIKSELTKKLFSEGTKDIILKKGDDEPQSFSLLQSAFRIIENAMNNLSKK